MTPVQDIAIPVLFVWLLAETAWDLKDRNIPRWFSVVPLTTGLLHLAWVGHWPAAVMMTFSILGTHIAGRWRYAVAVAPVVFLAFLPGMLPLAIGWGLLYLAWELGWFGGADALAGAYLLVWFPGWEMLVGMVTGILIWNIGMVMLRYGKNAGLALWVTIQVSRDGTKTPGLGAFVLALGVWLVARSL